MTAVALLLIFVLDTWLALTAARAVAAGLARLSGGRGGHEGQAERRGERQGHEFWLLVAAKAAAAVIFFLYLASVAGQIARGSSSARTSSHTSASHTPASHTPAALRKA